MVKLSVGSHAGGRMRARMAQRWKRVSDFSLALLLIFLLLPLFAAVALAVRLSSRGPVLFRQVRMGRGLHPFLIYKFRTMTCSAPHDAPTAALASGRYITRVGRFLRRTSLDELPQLYNILRGDMSFIGPRPVVLAEEELIARRLDAGVYRVRPGLSGLAQILGRDRLNTLEKTALDRLYVRYATPIFDLKLLLASFLPAISGRGVCEGEGDLKGEDLVRTGIP